VQAQLDAREVRVGGDLEGIVREGASGNQEGQGEGQGER
jgi:hypothetical protein